MTKKKGFEELPFLPDYIIPLALPFYWIFLLCFWLFIWPIKALIVFLIMPLATKSKSHDYLTKASKKKTERRTKDEAIIEDSKGEKK